MLFFIAASTIAFQPQSSVVERDIQARAGVSVQAIATVRIEQAAKASPQDWKSVPPSSKREVVVRGEGGEPVLLRIVDYE